MNMAILAIKDDLSFDILIYVGVYVSTHVYIMWMHLDENVSIIFESLVIIQIDICNSKIEAPLTYVRVEALGSFLLR